MVPFSPWLHRMDRTWKMCPSSPGYGNSRRSWLFAGGSHHRCQPSRKAWRVIIGTGLQDRPSPATPGCKYNRRRCRGEVPSWDISAGGIYFSVVQKTLRKRVLASGLVWTDLWWMIIVKFMWFFGSKSRQYCKCNCIYIKSNNENKKIVNYNNW